MSEKYPLLVPIGGKKVTGCQPTISCHISNSLDFVCAKQTVGHKQENYQ